MIKFLVKKIFGTPNARYLKELNKILDKINALEPEVKKLANADFAIKTEELKKQLNDGVSADDILVSAFSLVREASFRSIGLRPFDSQILGAIALHHGRIAEMGTGEGKTLVATMPAYLNALNGNSHIVTVNDYLAKRDSVWMAPVYELLGLSVGFVDASTSKESRQEAYKKDILYITNTEVVFDFLRDNMALAKEDQVGGELSFVIVDEADSALIDNARTPIVISGSTTQDKEIYNTMNLVTANFKMQDDDNNISGDFKIDEKHKQVFLTDRGHTSAETELAKHNLLAQGSSLYDAQNIFLIHYIHASLKANFLMKIDIDYLIKDNQIVIIDEHSGRAIPGRRWGEGLHQAVESKEGLTIQDESQTLASITFQNFFRQYSKIAGMTGTAQTEAQELHEVYGVAVVTIPSNKPVIRTDKADLVFLSKDKKYEAIIKDISAKAKTGQPILVGTVSIDDSELLSEKLTQAKIKHQVLNAKYHEQEAHIIANAGCKGAVTIATNMAGRGTDIVLGGSLDLMLQNANSTADKAKITAVWQEHHDAVLALGGLAIIGTERHESRRIDNQLRGRSGRQGDPGETKFYLSLEDGLMRIFASDKTREFMQKIGMGSEDTISAPMLTRAIENAQRKVEGHNFDIRKQLLQFDDISNDQRKVIYSQRSELLSLTDISDIIVDMRINVIRRVLDDYAPEDVMVEQWDLKGLEMCLNDDYGINLQLQEWIDNDDTLNRASFEREILQAMVDAYEIKENNTGANIMRNIEKIILLQVIDQQWKEHLATMDHLRQGIHLRGYAQKNPVQEYKKESFEIFTKMLDSIKFEAIQKLQIVRLNTSSPEVADNAPANNFANQFEQLQTLDANKNMKRNDICHCGSDLKYKHCHGKIVMA
jgi:preprotein translocase subunit SecA